MTRTVSSRVLPMRGARLRCRIVARIAFLSSSCTMIERYCGKKENSIISLDAVQAWLSTLTRTELQSASSRTLSAACWQTCPGSHLLSTIPLQEPDASSRPACTPMKCAVSISVLILATKKSSSHWFANASSMICSDRNVATAEAKRRIMHLWRLRKSWITAVRGSRSGPCSTRRIFLKESDRILCTSWISGTVSQRGSFSRCLMRVAKCFGKCSQMRLATCAGVEALRI
mmetsp:Transcript_76495/g.151356  ORF Transcript_76495/g.151356 Transcript_76495/m.151356 type:complete len:230 (+) Transcript_76495:438-1127(+)